MSGRLNTINHHINPFSNHFRQSVEDFRSLSLCKKIAAVAAAVFGAVATFYLLGIGGVATFQLAVKWLQTHKAGVQDADGSSETALNKARNQKVSELRRMLQLNHEGRKRKAVEQGFTVITDSTGFSGEGFLQGGRITYQGDYVDGHLQGKATIFYPNLYSDTSRKIYQGDMENDLKHGKGMVATDHWWIEGEYVNGFLNGKGTLRSDLDAFTCSGDFVDGEPDGDVNILWDSGGRYTGSGKLTFVEVDPSFIGNGTLTSISGMKFEGDIQIRIYNDRFTYSGNGKLTHSDGRQETGQITNWVKIADEQVDP